MCLYVSAYGTLTVRSLLDMVSHCLQEFNFTDPYLQVGYPFLWQIYLYQYLLRFGSGVHLNKRDCRCCTFDCVPTCTNTVEFNTDYKNELPCLHKGVVRRFFSFEVTVEIIEICIKMKNLSLLAFISFRVSQHIDSAANNDMLVVQLSSKDATSTLSHVVASCP